MILIDAIYINNGGGKVLLDYLIEELEKTSLNIFYLIDSRVSKDEYVVKATNIIVRMNSSLRLRNSFYKQNKFKFSKVFCLGNIPPNIKLNAEVFTYFHNPMYLSVPADFPLMEKFKYFLKVAIIKLWKKNTSNWLVQSETLKTQFIDKFDEKTKIIVLPFFPLLNTSHDQGFTKRKLTYFYVSNAQENKNHMRLIDAFCNFYDNSKTGELILTVSDKFPEVIRYIKNKQAYSYPITNIGFVDRQTLVEFYKTSEYVIFPSFAESFGLGLVEGIEFECKIIGADLPYTYAVCTPSIVFDPYNVSSIEKAINKTLEYEIHISYSNVENKINDLILKLT